MWTRGIVFAKPTSQAALSRQTVGVILHVDVFLFDAAPEPLDEPVVDPPTASIHAHVHAHRLHRVEIGIAGELTALVGVGEQRRSAASQRTRPSPDTKPAV